MGYGSSNGVSGQCAPAIETLLAYLWGTVGLMWGSWDSIVSGYCALGWV
jgi:hypothetical protein